MNRLENKKVFVTGAAGSIGQAVCHRFAEEGAMVAGVDRIKPSGNSLNIVANLSEESSLTLACETVLDKWESVDVVVHCAAMSDLASTTEVDHGVFSTLMTTNVFSTMQLASHFVPGMKRQGQGVFLLVSSITGTVGAPGMASYAASKGALHTVAKTMALELAPFQIRVNSLSPASIDTPMLREKFAQQDDPEKALKNNIARHPLGRLGTPQDVANLALFMCSDEASWITGSDYRIDGGATINRK